MNRAEHTIHCDAFAGPGRNVGVRAFDGLKRRTPNIATSAAVLERLAVRDDRRVCRALPNGNTGRHRRARVAWHSVAPRLEEPAGRRCSLRIDPCAQMLENKVVSGPQSVVRGDGLSRFRRRLGFLGPVRPLRPLSVRDTEARFFAAPGTTSASLRSAQGLDGYVKSLPRSKTRRSGWR